MKTKISVIAMSFLISLSACNSGGPKEVEVVAPAFAEPAPTAEKYSLLKANGTIWMNQQGEKVSLRGINIGNWLGLEMWMFGHEQPIGDGVTDQCSLEDLLVERFSYQEKEDILNTHRDSWFTNEDWDTIAAAGFNLVRIPFYYNLIESETSPYTTKANAWHYLDAAIEQAKARKIYVILDLHGAVGGQGVEQHTGCANQNQLWGNAEYRARTAWLWKQIAMRYKNEAAIAGYGLLNEPWGTDSETLKDYMVELYQAIREVDANHIIILPDHNSDGISAYGDPLDLGMENVAFEHHAYPGLFGWGEIGYEVHRDWLTCGKNGDTGVCDWAKRVRNVYTPMLIGETQPWVGLGELGGDITRATFDRYNALNWAATAWSYKTTSLAGGQGSGQWGLVTNNGDQLLVKAQTWSCNDWVATFDNTCDVSARSTMPYAGEGAKIMYLIIKTGAFNGSDVIYDNIALTNDATGENILSNGDFGNGDGWTELPVWGDPRVYDFNYDAGEFAGSDTGPALRVTSEAGNNSFIYQAVEVQGGQSYTISGKFKDNGDGGNDMWAEIYLVDKEPQIWQDPNGRVLPQVDINSSSLEEINDFFASFASMDYLTNDHVLGSLTQAQPPAIFTNIPSEPSNLVLMPSDGQVQLNWDNAQGDIDGYRIYRSTSPTTGFEPIGTSESTSYLDEGLDDITYYYYVAAYNSVDEGYGSSIQASGETFYLIPGEIQAENYSLAHPGVQTETAGDDGGGFNIGHFEVGRWVEYDVRVEQSGEYTVEYRLASVPGSNGFEVRFNDEVVETVTVPATGGWQDYQTVTTTITLTEGEYKLRLHSISNQWNLNWMRFVKIP